MFSLVLGVSIGPLGQTVKGQARSVEASALMIVRHIEANPLLPNPSPAGPPPYPHPPFWPGHHQSDLITVPDK